MLLVIAALLGAEPAKVTCDSIAETSSCAAYVAADVAAESGQQRKDTCLTLGGTWSTRPCPTKNLVGSCRDARGGVTYFYSIGAIAPTEADARKLCDPKFKQQWVPAKK